MHSPTQLSEIILTIQDTHSFRYVSAAGFVILFYDHLLTIVDEIQYIWNAPRSIEKHIYLFNRYLGLALMFFNAHQMCGLSTVSHSDRQCKLFLILTCFISLMSLNISNMLILRRVSELWKDCKPMKIFISIMYTASSLLSISLGAAAYVTLWPGIYWLGITNMCVATVSPLYTALLGAPLFFEISMAVSIVYTTMATPRSTSLQIAPALQRNGILYYLFVICFQLINVIVSGAARKTLALLCIYLSWATTSTLLSRSVIRLRKAEIEDRSRSMLLYSKCGTGLIFVPWKETTPSQIQ